VSRAGLIERLQQGAREEAASCWTTVRDEAGRLRQDASRQIDIARDAIACQVAAEKLRIDLAATSAAERDARDIRMNALIALANRLHQLALAELPYMRTQDSEQIFCSLATELPDLKWDRLRIHPADQALAQRQFPDAQIECDAKISGGVDVEVQGGCIRVNNTLEARLETVWPEVLSTLVHAILSDASNDPASAHR
jgi:vacuolar-type H+-ATPase subunit E/Vma4